MKNGRLTLRLVVVLLLALVTLFPAGMLPTGRVSAIAPPESGSDLQRADGPETQYIIVRTPEGTACRIPTREEAEYWRAERGRENLRVLGADGLNRVASTDQAGLKIILRATTQLENNTRAKEAFLRAAAYWESIITTPITVIIDVDFGPTRFGVPYPSANVIGSTSSQTLGSGTLYNSMRLRLIDRAGTTQQSQIFNRLPVGSLPTEIGSTTSVFVSSAVLRALGFIAPTADPTTETNYGSLPSIGFNSNFPFDFDPANGIDYDKIDFHATAVHEIGHFLGFSSYVGQSELNPGLLSATIWDFFRFRPGVTLDSFTSTPRLQISGSEHSHFAGFGEAALSTSRLDSQGGDGRQAPHWKDDVLTGRVLGIMDPTAATGIRDDISALDLQTLGHFGYGINPASTVTERLVLDDNTSESATVSPGALVVNRFTPARYPVRVKGIMLRIPFITDQPAPVGADLRLVIFRGGTGGGSSLPPANPQFLFNQVVSVPAIAGSRQVEFAIDGPTIESGDFYIGVQSSSAAGSTAVGISIDTNGTENRRSFISRDNGATFQPLNSLSGGTGPANFIARAIIAYPFNAQSVPSLASISPSIVPVGGLSQTVTLEGSNFLPESVVRFRDSDRTTKFLSSSQLQVALNDGDLVAPGSGELVVVTPGSTPASSAPQTLTIGTDNPAPAITRLDPPAGPLGASGLLVNVFGTNLNQTSRIRVNGVDRPTTFISSVQLATTLQSGDLAINNPVTINVANPAPGGGLSNALALTIAVCNYSISTSGQAAVASGGTFGVTVQTNSQVCAWDVTSDSAWVKILTPASASGVGKLIVNYQVEANTGSATRLARLTIGNQILLIRQYGLLTTVSAASYGTSSTADSIVVGFGAGLARSAQAVTTLPLPTNLGGTAVSVRDSRGSSRQAQLFYVSPQQVNYLVPTGTATGTATVSVTVDGATVSTGFVTVTGVAPSLFSANSSGRDVAAALAIRVRNQIQTTEEVALFNSTEQRFVARPIDLGPEGDRVFLALFGTGIRGRSSLSAVTVRLGSLEIKPDYAGPQQDFAGLDQVNFEMPRSLKGAGEVTVTLIVDGQVSNQVTIRVL